MSPRTRSVYVPPNQPMTISEKSAHYLAWCEKHKPGEYISYIEIALAVHNTRGKMTKNSPIVQGVSRGAGHIRRVLRQKYRLAWDSNDTGVRALNNVHDMSRHTVRKHVEKMAAVKRGLEADLELVDEHKNEFADNAEGKELKKFIGRVKGAVGSLSLPSREEIRGLLPPRTETVASPNRNRVINSPSLPSL